MHRRNELRLYQYIKKSRFALKRDFFMGFFCPTGRDAINCVSTIIIGSSYFLLSAAILRGEHPRTRISAPIRARVWWNFNHITIHNLPTQSISVTK